MKNIGYLLFFCFIISNCNNLNKKFYFTSDMIQYDNNILYEDLNLQDYTIENNSFALVAHISKIFGCQMSISEVYELIKNKCHNYHLFHEVKNTNEKYSIARKYLNKIKNKMKLKKENNSVYSKLVKNIIHTLFSDVIKCPAISKRLEAGIKLILIQINNDKFDENSYSQFLDEIEKIFDSNKISHISKLKLQLLNEDKILYLNKILIKKLANLFGGFLKSEVDDIKAKTEKLLNLN